MIAKTNTFLALALIAALAAVGCSQWDEAAPIRPERYEGVIRVACVGDSITYGSGIKDRDQNSYPAQLGAMLGKKWEVRNFGVGGATLLKRGDKPYWKQKAFQEALDFKPHAVVIKLGTNDTKPQNWQFKDEFAADYRDMIDRFSGLETRPRVWICQPVPAYPERWGIRDSVIEGELLPLVGRIGQDKKVPVIELYGVLDEKPEFFPDKIHPNAEGARLMAEEIYRALTGKSLAR